MSYAEVNGLRLYYESHGAGGEPLVLLHGGAGSVEMFAPVLPTLAERRQVIAVELQGHGRTADVDRPFRYDLMADDVAALVGHLGLAHADVMGYSLGGGVALRTAIRHPGAVRRLVVVSQPFRRDGWYPEVLAGMNEMGAHLAESMKATPVYELYSRIAPRRQDWPVLWSKLGDLLRQEYDWTEEVAALTVPTMLVFADADAVRTAHVVEFWELLGGGQRDPGIDGSGRPDARLAILPGATHYDIFSSRLLAATVARFLHEPIPEPG